MILPRPWHFLVEFGRGREKRNIQNYKLIRTLLPFQGFIAWLIPAPTAVQDPLFFLFTDLILQYYSEDVKSLKHISPVFGFFLRLSTRSVQFPSGGIDLNPTSRQTGISFVIFISPSQSFLTTYTKQCQATYYHNLNNYFNDSQLMPQL